MTKKRLAIYCFYEEAGYVDKYVEHILSEIDSVCSRLIVVVNGELGKEGKEILEKYADEVLLRENKGYDGAAYKEAIFNIGALELRKYEEVFLCNNSFFGPFLKLETLFADAEKESADFWGLSYRNTGIAAFIESYFLVFRENIVQSGALWDYFAQLVEIRNYEEARIFFERGIFHFFYAKGFKYGSLCSKRKYSANLQFPYEVLQGDKLPILKKKCFYQQDCDLNSLHKALTYIQSNYKEWAAEIDEWMQRVGIVIQNESENNIRKAELVNDYIECVTIQDIQKWIEKFDYIYLYGNGLYSHMLIRLFGLTPRGIIVSDEQWKGELWYDDIEIIKKSSFEFECDNVGIIVAVSRTNFKDICNSMGKRDNLLCIWDSVT